MKGRWTDAGQGRRVPMVLVGIRRRGKTMPTSSLLLIDTGADSTVLPIFNATMLGISPSDLKEERCGVAGGEATFHRLVDVADTEIEIDGSWLPVPSLTFTDRILHPVLGRDFIFAHFSLRMTGTQFELLPIP